MANAAHGPNSVPLTIQTRLLPSAIAGTPYVAALDATGGSSANTWAVTSGHLPTGVALSPSTGVISGTPTVTGNFSVGLTVTDPSSANVKRTSTTVTISVAPPVMSMASTTTLFAANGVAYSQALHVTGGTPAYTWSVASGQLPPGLSLASSTGIISGTPTTSGIISFTVGVQDSEHPAKTQSTVVTMDIAPAQLRIVAAASATVIAGSSFSENLQAVGGTPGYIWSIPSGSLPSGLVLNPSTGTISGVPTASSTATFTAMVNDGGHPAQASSALVTIVVAAPRLTIASSVLPSVTVGTAYNQTLQVSGGTAPYKWSISSGQLAPGLTLNSAGTISGSPTASGSTSFTATVTDSSSPVQSASTTSAVTVTPNPLKVSAPVLPTQTVGATYSQSFSVSGGTAPYTWQVTSGALPAGLTLTPSGTISGIATASGTSTFTATVTDSSSPVQSASTTSSVTVTPTPLKVSAPVLPTHTVGATYSQSFSVSGGTAPYTWHITSGALPTGLTLTPLGTVSGIATASGTSTFTATVTDSSSPSQSASATAGIVVAPTPLLITSSSLAGVTVGSGYSQALQASGGTAPYQWNIASGNLPAGLNLTPSTGMISGTATTSGTATFTATVTDSSSPAQVTSTTTSLTVSPTALSITSSTLATATSGTAYLQTLQASGGTAPYTWSIGSGQLPLGLSLSSSGAISGTPISSTSSSFTVTVTDNSTPTQVQSATLTIAATAPPPPPTPPLSITSSTLSDATTGSSYLQTLQASGGTPAYTWSIKSGSLPAGLTLAATTGVISGTPSASGTSNFTVGVSDNGTPAKTTLATTSIVVAAPPAPAGPGTTWFIRPDGGTRYSANVPSGQCDGLSDTAYPGSGTNQHCAYNDFRYMWDDDSGYVGAGAWVIAGGDTIVIRGCHALPTQQNPSGSNCRIGWDQNGGGGPSNLWCQYVGSYTCYNPPIPAGTASQHTRILGGCAYGTYSCTPIDNNYPYTNSNETQIFGGMSLAWTFNLASTQYVDVEGIELTTHNGQCTTAGAPSYPRSCSKSSPLDDFANNGFITDAATSNLTLQDVYVHGFNASGFYGPIGGPVTMTRVFSGFNAFAGWNFADGSDTADAAGSQILAHYVTMIGNGCYEQYPIVNTAFPAQACYDDVSSGFGDAWSGQDTDLDTFICDHCTMAYNTKDAFIGPHANVHTLTITESRAYGNMGAQWKWNNTPNATTTFENNLTVGNCARFAAAIPGAAHSFAKSSGLPGAYLSDYCRAGGNTVAINSQADSYVLFANNTFIDYLDTVVLMSCGPNNHNQNGQCGHTPFVFTNNIFLSYHLNGDLPPGLFYINDSSITVTSTNNIEYGNRTNIYGASCGTGGNICSDPMLVNEPPQQAWDNQTFLDDFNFHVSSGSPAIGAGIAYSTMLPTDFYGISRPATPTIGGVEP